MAGSSTLYFNYFISSGGLFIRNKGVLCFPLHGKMVEAAIKPLSALGLLQSANIRLLNIFIYTSSRVGKNPGLIAWGK